MRASARFMPAGFAKGSRPSITSSSAAGGRLPSLRGFTRTGKVMAEYFLVNILRGRLRAERWWDLRPSALDVPIERPIIITGLVRTGSTAGQTGWIADRYLNIPCSCMSPNPRRLEFLSRFREEYAVDGVVDVILQACHTYAVESFSVREHLKGLGIPYIAVETDYSQGDEGQLSTRLNAFLEML